jgi:DNA-binding response OmpR family regulator
MAGERILAVDDDAGILRVFRSVLESEGYKVETASSGADAIKLAKTSFFNLALLDIMLPDMQGTELLNELKKIAPRMIKIMMTGFPSIENTVKSLNLHADAFLTKPFRPDELLAVINEQLSKRREEESSGPAELFSDLHDIRARQLREKSKEGPSAGGDEAST